MKLNNLLKSILRSVVYVMDETVDRVDRVSERASRLADDTKSMIYPNEGSALRKLLSFTAGIGVGVAAGFLLAPSSGQQLRDSIRDRVQNIGGKIRGRTESYATGTDLR